MDADAARHVQAYLEYQNIVGNADNGKIMNEREFEEFKTQVREARKNRLYVHYRNQEGTDCKTIGPASQCFCGHRYKEHFFDNVETREVYCKANGKAGRKCRCKMFEYIPIFGSQDLKCLCKHSCTDHDPNGVRKCQRAGCSCIAFNSKHSCNCGLSIMQHETIFESREERQADGRQVDPKWMQDQNMVGGMGGLTADFQALADGQDLQDLRNPAAIMGNLNNANMLMGPDMAHRAIQGGPQRQQRNPLAI
mmetsp:Transcript_921/g.1650  ORF Transcript_921/g.1650 Transcript_921/m.1650 type:complete len:251 (+) Transcript_921:12-764(+)